MNKLLLASFSLFFILSCRPKKTISDLERFFVYENIKFNHPEKMNQNIVRPLNAWVVLFESKFKCFYYRTAFRKRLGHIKLTRKKDKCDYEDSAIYEDRRVDSIKYIKISTNQDDLKIRLEINNEEITYRLLNTELNSKKEITLLDQSYLSDIFVDRDIKNIKKLGDLEICHGVNSNCQDVVGYRCERCPGSFYEVVDFNCPQGGSKYCGVEDCGKKNKPACPRGYEVLETKLKSLCFDGSPAGFCGPGLQTFCNEDNILICL